MRRTRERVMILVLMVYVSVQVVLVVWVQRFYRKPCVSVEFHR